MKKLIRFLVFTALVATLALPALAQTPATTPTPAATATQDDQEAKTALYNKFRDNLKTNPQVAYEAGKEYLAKYEATDGPTDQYVSYIKKWVDSYDKIARRNQVIQQLNAKQYNEAFAGARQVLTDYPDDLALLFELSKAGLSAAIAGNTANNAAAVDYARRTLQMIQAGKTFEKDKPITNKEEITGGLNYALGFLLRESQPAEAANYLIAAAQAPGVSQKDPYTYSFLAVAYEQSEYTKLRNEYEANCKTEEQLKAAQCTELTTKVNNVVDRMIDALARAIAYSKTSANAAELEKARTAWMEQLTALYKYRNNGDTAGIEPLIASITTKPLPRPGQPTTTPMTTPASNTTTPQTTPPGTTSTTPTTPANGGTTSSTTPKPNR
ncbi:MAG TPA: hypothetical protein VJ715_09855 [Pyrinomonadaceae bacterium]|nr:hypothetical protein [Pyrinomonadaceae bacterium]